MLSAGKKKNKSLRRLMLNCCDDHCDDSARKCEYSEGEKKSFSEENFIFVFQKDEKKLKKGRKKVEKKRSALWMWGGEESGGGKKRLVYRQSYNFRCVCRYGVCRAHLNFIRGGSWSWWDTETSLRNRISVKEEEWEKKKNQLTIQTTLYWSSIHTNKWDENATGNPGRRHRVASRSALGVHGCVPVHFTVSRFYITIHSQEWLH